MAISVLVASAISARRPWMRSASDRARSASAWACSAVARASSASWRAACSAANAASRSRSTRTRSVTSVCTPTKLTSCPSPSKTGLIASWFQNAVPSLRWLSSVVVTGRASASAVRISARARGSVAGPCRKRQLRPTTSPYS